MTADVRHRCCTTWSPTTAPGRIADPLDVWTDGPRVVDTHVIWVDPSDDAHLAEVFGVAAVAWLMWGHRFLIILSGHQPGRLDRLIAGDIPVTAGGEYPRTYDTFRDAVAAYAYRWATNRGDSGEVNRRIRRGDLWPLPNVELGDG